MTVSPRQNPSDLLKKTNIDGQSNVGEYVEGRDSSTTEQELFAEENLEDFMQNMFGTSPAAEEDPRGIPTMYWLKSKFKTKSAIIRYLFQEKRLAVKEISKHTGFLYQQCRNVLTNELKRGPNESFKLGADDQIVKSLVPLLPKKSTTPTTTT
jgi:hypothetical protein